MEVGIREEACYNVPAEGVAAEKGGRRSSRAAGREGVGVCGRHGEARVRGRAEWCAVRILVSVADKKYWVKSTVIMEMM